MKLQQIPARQGITWVRNAFRLFFRQPLAFAGLFAVFLFAAFLVALLPGIGSVLLLAALPVVTLGFMMASRSVRQGEFPTPKVFVQALRGERTRTVALLKLCVAYAAATLLIMWLSDLVDGGALDALMETMAAGKATQEEQLALLSDPRLKLGLALRFGLAGLLSLPFWHAPALVHFAGQSAAQALFSSTLACWRNKGAFAVYSLGWVAVVLVFGLLSNLFFALLGQPQLMLVAATPAGLMLSTVFYVSLYDTYADCFGIEPAVA